MMQAFSLASIQLFFFLVRGDARICPTEGLGSLTGRGYLYGQKNKMFRYKCFNRHKIFSLRGYSPLLLSGACPVLEFYDFRLTYTRFLPLFEFLLISAEIRILLFLNNIPDNFQYLNTPNATAGFVGSLKHRSGLTYTISQTKLLVFNLFLYSFLCISLISSL